MVQVCFEKGKPSFFILKEGEKIIHHVNVIEAGVNIIYKNTPNIACGWVLEIKDVK